MIACPARRREAEQQLAAYIANKYLARDLRAPERIPLADIVRWRQGNSAMLGDKSIPCAVRVRYSGVWLMRGIA
ncbi:MAG: hypothetical protein WB756_24295, partial [Xanthobacteraceae bacterium]